MTGSFARNVQHLLSAVDLAELARVLQAIYQPFEGYKQRYVYESHMHGTQ